VIYYFYNEEIPLYLLTLFGKNEQANLTKAERNALADLVPLLVESSKRKNRWQTHSKASSRV